MKLRINGFENELNLENGKVNIVQIENSKLFTHVIDVLNDKINGIDNNEIFLLDEKNEELNISKEMIIIFDMFNIDFNTKKIIGKIYDIISNNIRENSDELIEKINFNIRKKLINELNDLPFNFDVKETIDVLDLLKIYNVKIDFKMYSNILEKVELLIDIISNLKIATVLIIPNLKSYFSEKELLELYKYSLYNEISLISIERRKYRKLKYEQILYIDNEYDEVLK